MSSNTPKRYMERNDNVSQVNVSQLQWEPYLKGLRMLKVLGLPLKITVDENKIIFVDHFGFVKFGILISMLQSGATGFDSGKGGKLGSSQAPYLATA